MTIHTAVEAHQRLGAGGAGPWSTGPLRAAAVCEVAGEAREWDEPLLERLVAEMDPTVAHALARNPALPAWAVEWLLRWGLEELEEPSVRRWSREREEVVRSLARWGRLEAESEAGRLLFAWALRLGEGSFAPVEQEVALRARSHLLSCPHLPETCLEALLGEPAGWEARRSIGRVLSHPSLTDRIRGWLWERRREVPPFARAMAIAAALLSEEVRGRAEVQAEVRTMLLDPETAIEYVRSLVTLLPPDLFAIAWRRLQAASPESEEGPGDELQEAEDLLVWMMEKERWAHLAALRREDLLPLLERGSTSGRLVAMRTLAHLSGGEA